MAMFFGPEVTVHGATYVIRRRYPSQASVGFDRGSRAHAHAKPWLGGTVVRNPGDC